MIPDIDMISDIWYNNRYWYDILYLIWYPILIYLIFDMISHIWYDTGYWYDIWHSIWYPIFDVIPDIDMISDIWYDIRYWYDTRYLYDIWYWYDIRHFIWYPILIYIIFYMISDIWYIWHMIAHNDASVTLQWDAPLQYKPTWAPNTKCRHFSPSVFTMFRNMFRLWKAIFN